MDEIKLYEDAVAEVDSAQMKRGLWAKAFAEADGEPNKARALYLRWRVAEMVHERSLAHGVVSQQPVATETSNLDSNTANRPAFFQTPKELVTLLFATEPGELYKSDNQYIIHVLAQKTGIDLERAPELTQVIAQILVRRKDKISTAKVSFKWALSLFAVGAFLTVLAISGIGDIATLRAMTRFVSIPLWFALFYALWSRLTAPGAKQVLDTIRNARRDVANAKMLEVSSQGILQERQLRAQAELQTVERARLARLSEEQRRYDLLSKGRCPNCEAVIPLSSQECPKCKAIFTSDASWKVLPLHNT